MSTVDVLIKGRNFPLLLDRLKKRGVKVYKISEKGSFERVIRVKYRDRQKVFAICQNMWYNKSVKVNGLIGLFKRVIRYLPFVVFAAAFVVCSFWADNYILDIDVVGSARSDKAKIFALIDEMGIKTPCKKDDLSFKGLEKAIYQAFDGIDFVTVKKSGNRLIIDLICGKSLVKKTEKITIVKAKRSGVITRMGIYSGTCLKKVGDSVVAFETIAEGFYIEGEGEDQRRIEVPCKGSYDLMCTQKLEVVGEFLSEEEVLAVAVLESGIDQSLLIDKNIIQTVKGENTIYTVSLTYLFTEGF